MFFEFEKNMSLNLNIPIYVKPKLSKLIIYNRIRDKFQDCTGKNFMIIWSRTHNTCTTVISIIFSDEVTKVFKFLDTNNIFTINFLY